MKKVSSHYVERMKFGGFAVGAKILRNCKKLDNNVDGDILTL